MANPIPWPEIEQHGLRVASILNDACDAATRAQAIIARRWRERKTNGRVTPGRRNQPAGNGLSRADVAKFFSTPNVCTATGKLDGTNVGIDINGALFGRRTPIPDQNESYQKTPLSNLRGRSSQVKALRAAIASVSGIPELETLPLMLYGELCVNKLYEYDSSYAAGTFKTWRVFGVAIQVQNPTGGDELSDVGVSLAQRLAAAGFRARAGPTVVVSVCDKLRSLVDEINTLEPEREPLICVGEMGRGSLVEVVDQVLTWMLEMRGEGLVLTYPAFGADLNSGLCHLGKWKCAQEPQSNNIKQLARLVHRFSEEGDVGPSVANILLPAGVVDMVTKMHAVATAGMLSPFKEAKKGPGQKTKKKNTQSSEQHIAVQEAIASALTKFDSPEAYFERDERKQFTTMVIEEVAADLKADEKLKKLVCGQVNKHIGQAFGSWKFAKAQSASGTTT